jgi:uncharacterized protein (TIGR02594 family)
MPDSAPSWLETMRGLDGIKFSPGDGHPNPKIQDWLRFIGTTFPNMVPYCNEDINSDYFSWCGATVGYCMAKAGIAPVFGDNDNSRFLLAVAWLGWGTSVTAPQQGDVLVFDFGHGDHHVTLFEKDNGDGTYSCHGGNQSHEVNQTNFHKSNIMGIRRPILTAGAQQQPVAVVAADTLAPGAVGRAVTALQTALLAKGFDPGGIDGEFGSLTSAAISGFQRAQNLPVTGIADPATLKILALSADGGQQPNVSQEEPTMQVQDLLTTLVNALVTKQQGSIPAPTPPATQGPVDISGILQVAIAALAGKPLPGLPVIGAVPGTVITTTAPPVLSTIDQIFGGQALVGKKSIIAVIAYAILAVFQAHGDIGTAMGATATPTGEILTTLIGGFGALGGLSKIDRLTQVLNLVANQTTPPQL